MIVKENFEENDWTFSIVEGELPPMLPDKEGKKKHDYGFRVLVPAVDGAEKPRVLIREDSKIIKEKPLAILTEMQYAAAIYKDAEKLEEFMMSTMNDFQSFMWDQYHVRF